MLIDKRFPISLCLRSLRTQIASNCAKINYSVRQENIPVGENMNRLAEITATSIPKEKSQKKNTTQNLSKRKVLKK